LVSIPILDLQIKHAIGSQMMLNGKGFTKTDNDKADL